MANATFNASVLADVQLLYKDVFGGNTNLVTNKYLKNETPLVKEMVARAKPTVKMREIMENGTCVGRKVRFIRDCDTTDLDCDATALNSNNCDLPVGTIPESVEMTLPDWCGIQETITLDDDDCANQFKFNEVLATKMIMVKAKMRTSIEKKLMAEILAKAAQNTFTPHVQSNWVVGNQTNIPQSYWTMQIIPQLGLTAKWHRMQDYLIVDGWNLAGSLEMAPYMGMDDDKRHNLGILRNYNVVMTDPTVMQGVTGAASTLLIDTSMLAFLTHNYATNRTPQYIDYTNKNLEWWYENDPFVDGLRYDIRHTKVCTGLKNGVEIFKHTFNIRTFFQTIFNDKGCPIAPATAPFTGILHFTSV